MTLCDGFEIGSQKPLTLISQRRNVEVSRCRSSNAILAAKLAGLTLFTSYAVKYGELFLDLPFQHPNAMVAAAMIVGIRSSRRLMN